METLDEAAHANVLRAMLRVGLLTSRAAVLETDTWLLIDAGVDMPEFNFALPKAAPAEPEAALDDLVAWYRARGQHFHLQLRERADAGLVEAAANRGWLSSGTEPSMLLAPLPAAEAAAARLTIREARSEADIVRYAEVDGQHLDEITRGIAATAGHFPDFHLILGELDGHAVGTALAVVTGEMVGIYNVHVQPAYRHRGFGRELTHGAIEAGRVRGATAACLQATPMGEPLYAGIGFRTLDRYLGFLSG